MSHSYGATDPVDPKINLSVLTQRIGTNLQNIRQITQNLNEMCMILGGPHDSSSKQDDIHKQQVKANNLLELTKSLFESLSQLGVIDQDCRLQINRIKEEYESVIRKYGETQSKIMTKMNQIAKEKRLSIADSLVDIQEDFQNQTQMTENDEELRLAEEVEKRVQQLEKDMINVQKMYSDINEIMIEERQVVEMIEQNVESAHSDVEGANVQLMEATIYKRKALKKKIIIIVVVLILLAIIGLIIGLEVKKK